MKVDRNAWRLWERLSKMSRRSQHRAITEIVEFFYLTDDGDWDTEKFVEDAEDGVKEILRRYELTP